MEQIRTFLEASDELDFEAADRGEIYEWVERTLCQQEYWKQNRASKGLLRRYVSKMTGLSRAQVTRLLTQYAETGRVREKSYRRNRFASRYRRDDVELLGEVDEAC